jgi:hypothetical protein
VTPRSWLDDETSAALAIRQAGALFSAGLRRTAVLLAVSTLYAAALASAVLWLKHAYAPEYVLRIVEAERETTGMPRPRRQLAEYVRTAVFTSRPLMDVMNRHGLYALLAHENVRAALEAFRGDIDVEVRQNYFVEERAPGAAPRTARLVISYRSNDLVVAQTVTRELGQLVAMHEQAARKDQATRAANRAREQLDEARAALAVRRSEVTLLAAEVDGGAVSPERLVAFIGKLGSLSALEAHQDESERREASLSLGAALEEQGISMRFEVVNDASLATETDAKQARPLIAGLALALGLPLIAISVGAFNPRGTPS